MRSPFALVFFVLLVALAAGFGAWFRPGEWYAALAKPPLTPPDWVFGPAWTFLYACVALAAWRVWCDPAKRRWPLALWGMQLILNALWSWLFFGLNEPGLALVEIMLLLGLIAATTAAFFRVDAAAGRLFVPYLAWVSFAAYLNAGVWFLNR